MDYGPYRDPRLSRMPSSSMGVPVTTITTGIPLSKRFAILEQTKAAYASEGYGVQRPSPAIGRGNVGGASALMNRRLALALARNSRAALASPAAQRFRVPIQARLGLSRGRPGGRGGAQNGRGGGLRHIQKGAGAIARRSSPVKPRGGGGGVKVLAVRGRGAGVAMRASGRGRGVATGGGRGGGGARGRGGARGAGRGKNTKPVSKDDLDSELDSYMAKTRGYLDKQLDEYMAQAKASQEAIAAGTVAAAGSEDVSMTDA